MAKIANVASTIDTFDTWRSRSNASFDRLSQFAINNSSLYANTITANVAFTSTGLATLSGRATVGTNLTVSGNTTLGAAGKTITTTGAAAHTGTKTISTNLTVSGNTTLGAAGKTITTTGAAAHTGTKTISTNLTVSGNTSTNKATVTSSLTVSGNTTLGAAGKTITTTGAAAHTGTKTISTNLTVSGNTAINGSTLSTTSVSLTALAGATTLLTLGGTGASAVLAIPSTLEQSTTTGALTVAGGVYIAKKLNVVGVATLGNGAILGTPASGTVTNLTGTASININGTVGATTATTGAFTSLSSTIGANFATSSGNVGIGTASPTHPLTVLKSNPADWAVKFSNSSASGISGFGYYDNSDTWKGYVGYDNGAANFLKLYATTGVGIIFLTNTAEAMRITSAGNVGIGTAAPNVNLEVYNATSVAQRLTAGSNIFEFINNSTENRISAIAALPLTFRTSNVEAMRIDSSGNVTLQKNISVGAAAPTTSGTGITFPATQSASTNANTLDDYEEGTWTPSFTGLTVVGTPTYTGTYVKVGRMVALNLEIASTTSTSSAGGGSTTFTGLPFTPNSSGGAVPFVNNSNTSLGNGLNVASSATIYCPAWTAVSIVYMSYTYQV